MSWSLPSIDADVTRARTLPGWVHADDRFFAHTQESVLRGAWSFVASAHQISVPNSVLPTELPKRGKPEPLLLTRSEDGCLRALSNVCTHRANLIQTASACVGELRCGYHGRRFALDGTLRASPGFDKALDFPCQRDNLASFSCGEIGPAVFASHVPALELGEWSRPVQERLGHLPWDCLQGLPERDRDFEIDASWILYVENFLEGFHVPFVHPGLSRAINIDDYSQELLGWGTLQVAKARKGEPSMCGPARKEGVAPLEEQQVAAYYLWLFPTTMLNLYPWGLSLNAVEPISVDRTRVRFRSYVWNEDLLDRGAGADLWQVEMEDEAVVQACQRGNTSETYQSGRYSPDHERGLHRFHRLLLEVLRDGWEGAHQRA